MGACGVRKARWVGAAAMCAALAGCSSGGNDALGAQGWSAPGLDVVSKAAVGNGIAAVTALRTDGTLETDTFDLARGKRLWAKPAAMRGRTPDQGVQPPAVSGRVVAAVEPQGQGAVLVARDARTGALRWTRDVRTTFGPQACGPMLCLAERTADADARFVALDPSAQGRELWRMDGVAEVEWADASRVIVFRMAKHPALEARDLRSGRALWSLPVENAVGNGVNLSGGWAFGSLGDTLVGYLGPHQTGRGQPLTSFGFFAVRAADGALTWSRPRLLRVYPSASPAVALIARQVTPAGGYGGFEQVDPRTGRTAVTLPADRAPRSSWWLSLPSDLAQLGFLTPDRPGRAVALRDAAPVPAHGLRMWSFCTVTPSTLKITGRPGFYPVAPLCAFDLGSGRRIGDPGAPPGWYTGATDGWRVWRDESGTLHALHDARGTAPGMYGP
ncbi:outer membrane protein assembly factor BamB family protein [Actinomadura rupiterrae]|uniref:outer membrane protein assembly factor BamB family protein n=1 Tax=Actinomadura rupiterrae TaxID=559627 RepID=UPI0020A2A532|nr:PQQ-binding-like beta-propeller repeat protein [Actinomadura rupiterrae]MCP2336783.1 outer membrane protein assembly factor BamB [Actinomadura rupiterrae]